MISNTADAVITPLRVIAFCQPLTGPSVIGWVWVWVPASGAAHPGWAARKSCDALSKASSLKTGFAMVQRLYPVAPPSRPRPWRGLTEFLPKVVRARGVPQIDVGRAGEDALTRTRHVDHRLGVEVSALMPRATPTSAPPDDVPVRSRWSRGRRCGIRPASSSTPRTSTTRRAARHRRWRRSSSSRS